MLASPSRKSNGVARLSTGTIAADGTAVTVNLGFNPSHFYLVNQTDVTTFEKLNGMAAANTIKVVAAGTMTLDTGSAIVFNGDGTVTISATAAPNAKSLVWLAK